MFTKRKFQDFPVEQQHKKCSEILKRIYENLLSGKFDIELVDHYQQLQQWMDLKYRLNSDLKQISDRYHYHLKLAKQTHQEHGLLPNIRQGDREKSDDIWPIAIYLDHLRSAHNVGSIVRTVEAFALGSIYFSDQTPFIDHKQVQDASMGTFKSVKCYQDIPPVQLPKPLIALETSRDAVALNEFIFPSSFTLALGNEEYGCSDEVLRLADYVVEIPLRGRKNSLNVANAFAIAANEIQRQRKE
ncbi:MAG: TrmH family RNA methyltransferase [Parachlamydiaceae bacterium]|nr:MAG: TrmH family RNA methyltransferase [Parachlamydiaceae bacterium]